jgi:hypothetical protein
LKVLTTGLSSRTSCSDWGKASRNRAARTWRHARSGTPTKVEGKIRIILVWPSRRRKPIYDPLPPDLIRHPVTTGGFPREIGILIRHRAVADVTDQVRGIASVSAVCDGVTDKKEGVGVGRQNRTGSPPIRLPGRRLRVTVVCTVLLSIILHGATANPMITTLRRSGGNGG